MNNKIELLAPSGSYESLVAAVQNGADAVYLAGMRFGARANASNFDNDEIINAVKYAHERNVKVYVTVNIIVNDDEIADCMEYISFLYNNDVDAVIVQDIGVANLINKYFPEFEIHASTQMSISNSLDAMFYKNMGFSRLVAARENSIEEIKNIKSFSDTEIESFVHGALCVSYSGKCLFSFIQGGRSGNRGNCAQPCRMKYDLNSPKGDTTIENKYILSMKDLSTITNIKEIVSGNIDSLKIEGRMKRPEYVAIVVKNYRKAIDGILNDTITPEELTLLENEIKYVFNREYTSGHILSSPPGKMANLDSPKNKGVYLGEVLDVDTKMKRIKIKLEDDLSKGDGLSIGEFVGRIIHRKEIKNFAAKGETIELDFIGNAKAGDRIYKTYNTTIMNAATESYKKEFIKSPLSFSLKFKIGENPQIFITDNRNNKVSYKDDEYTVEAAINRPTDEETITRQMSKLDSTSYFLKDISIEKDENAVIPVSMLNKLRRESISMITAARENINKRAHYDTYKMISDINDLYSVNVSQNVNSDNLTSDSDFSIAVKCFNEDQIKACIDSKVNRIYISDMELYKNYAKNDDANLYHFITPGMMKDKDIADLQDFINEYNPNIMTNSLGHAKHISKQYLDKNINNSVGIDYMANLNNKFSIDYTIKSFEANLDTLSPGLEYVINQQYLDYTFFESQKSKIEIPVATHPILMITEYCPYKTDGARCKFPNCVINDSTLNGENNEIYKIKTDSFCKLYIYSSRIVELHVQSIKTLKESNYNRFRIDLLDETYDNTIKLINKYKRN
ncbi:peptidase U32 family protein [Proteocatella sphenisci]|uniref:peptidase U32 family protein n=1 Tax=Proteocatella sphenisci TaxID=181070 RepID=UPI00048ADEB3|nr:U32 family peptidase [Proteocatella sphenisci]